MYLLVVMRHIVSWTGGSLGSDTGESTRCMTISARVADSPVRSGRFSRQISGVEAGMAAGEVLQNGQLD